jgi:hypothetical protein
MLRVMPVCPDSIKRLIERFDQQSDQVRSPEYNETQLRIDFVNPMFAALGWDMDNSAGYAEQYRDVVHEDRVKVAGMTKAPDYSFRIGGARKFFLEAKKPFVNLKTAWEPAYQLRRYGWSAKLAVSILTDFEEMAVYDCRVAPRQFDKPAVARRDYLTYHEYTERWDFIEGTFSKRAVLQGEFDRYCQTAKGRGRQEFDDTFLEEIEEWRRELANNLALRNESLDEPGLNFSVQRIIDRIIFLRIAEDRGTEGTGQLMGLLNGDQTYARLKKLFIDADVRYNSGLFHFENEKGRDETPDTLTTGLEVDDAALKKIIKRLYYPESPYEFTVVNVDILGSVYERFLGKLITLTAGHRARIEEKPEVRKAGGVYYTPAYIVDYIVKNTVGKLLENKTPKEAANLKVLDPACGSGSFLIGAYQHLLDWYLARYTASEPAKLATGKNAVLRPSPAGNWRLTIAERKRILLDNIHGVDLDSAAVEVTKLNLLLKCLEGETSQTLGFQHRFSFGKERALPDLGHNVLCGNSLVGSDMMSTDAWKGMDDRAKRRLNPFDYEREFSPVFEGGGFDALIGNPPWGADLDEPSRRYLNKYPRVADFESSQYFLHRVPGLSKPNGLMGMIVPNTFFLNVWAKGARAEMGSAGGYLSLVDLSELDVFLGPNVRSGIILWKKAKAEVCTCLTWVRAGTPPVALRDVTSAELSAASTWKQYFEAESPARSVVIRLAATHKRLSDFASVRQGYIPYRTTTLTRRHGARRAAEILEGRLFHSNERVDDSSLREIQGADVGRYRLEWSGTWVRYGHWVSTHLPVEEVFSGDRVLIREVTGKPPHRLLATVTDQVFVHNPSVLAVAPQPGVSPRVIAGVLNSKLGSLLFSVLAPKAKKGLFPKIIITDAKLLPFPAVVKSKAFSDLDRLVAAQLELSRRLASEPLPQGREQLEREIAATDRQIDKLVYQLYGLTADEVRIVEEATA